MNTDAIQRQTTLFCRDWNLVVLADFIHGLSDLYLEHGTWPEELMNLKTAALTAFNRRTEGNPRLRELLLQKPAHIREVAIRTAERLAARRLLEDPYHNAITAAAETLVARGHGDARYLTQHASGHTIWRLDADTTLAVSRDGRVIE